MGDILPYLGVSHYYAEDDAAGKTVVLEDMTGKTRTEVQKYLKSQNLTAVFVGDGETVTDQIPAAGRSVPGTSQVLVYMGEEAAEREVEVPDFAGLHRQQANDAAGALGLYILPKGNHAIASYITAVSQSIPKGTKVPVGTTIELEFADTRTSP